MPKRISGAPRLRADENPSTLILAAEETAEADGTTEGAEFTEGRQLRRASLSTFIPDMKPEVDLIPEDTECTEGIQSRGVGPSEALLCRHFFSVGKSPRSNLPLPESPASVIGSRYYSAKDRACRSRDLPVP